MNKPFYNPENIESYIANKMSASDRALFENELAKDPLLSNEINLQKDIVESLKAFRKAELKGRLNNIEVSVGSSYTGLKVAASVLLASLISFGTYYYFTGNNTPDKPELEPLALSVQHSNSNVNTNSITESNESKTENNKIKVSKKDDIVIVQKATKRKPAVAPSPVIPEEKTNAPILNSQDVKDKFNEEEFQNGNDLQMPKGDVGTTTNINNIENLHIEVKNTKKQFHYQYYNNKLFLFGDFDSSPYEIFELNSKKDKELYLLYNNEFYGLKQGQTKITPLVIIKDNEKLNALNALRNK